MRRNIQAVFAISALIALILCSACTFLPTGETQEGGLVQVTVPSESTRISFDTAYQKLREYRTVTYNQSSITSEKIYYIIAKETDDQGKAASWGFGMNDDAGSRLLIFDSNGWTDIPLSNLSLPSEEIIVDHIVPPGNIFSENRAVIVGISPPSTAELRELELKESIYTLTISSDGNVRVIKFNATTGALIS
jgi:hypothetical protein